MKNYDLVVIGGGPAGLGAAAEARERGIDSILIIERDRELGGILNQCIHSGFGLHEFHQELTGPEYAQRFSDKIKELGVEYMLDTMVISLSRDRVITAVNKNGVETIKASAVVLAMGCRERTAGAVAINGYRPSGVYTAGTAQRLINIEGLMVGREIVIYGSGDIGLIMARRLTLEGARVRCVVEIAPVSSGLRRNIAQCLDDYGIPLYLSHKISEIHGKSRITGVTICEVDKEMREIKGTEKEFSCDTLLLSIGLIPENELSVKAGIDIDPRTHGPVVNSNMETCLSGVFACGNVLHVHDIVDFVTKESRLAGKNAANYIKGKLKEGRMIGTVAGSDVSYVIPGSVNSEDPDGASLYFRPKHPMKNVTVRVSSGEKTLASIKKIAVIPSEMINIELRSEDIAAAGENIVVEVVENE